MSDSAIHVEGLSKKYVIGHEHQERYKSLRDVITNRLQSLHQIWKPKENDPSFEEFWALKDVCFDIKQGDRVGIIGRNGAGKSTLLKILSRITEPTAGKISIKGRVSSLLEVGTGFHPELTGRENIFLNGAVLGMDQIEIKKKFDEIVAFAEVEKFLDTPVKRYSSGMYVRLAFAVAAHLEPEILIVDEVLAVGDAQFQKKCLGKMKDVSGEGRTVLFVSHSMPTITSLCSDVILLEKGKVVKTGNASEVIMHYYSTSGGTVSPAFVNYEGDRFVGDEYVQMLSGCVKNSQGEITPEISIDEDARVILRYRILKDCHYRFVPNFHFYTADGTCAFVTGLEKVSVLASGEYTAECNLPCNFLNEGAYFVGLAISSFESGVKVHFFEQNILSFNIKDDLSGRNHDYVGIIPGVVRPQLQWHFSAN
ncbi:MAG: ABC transporter ATP-binding protein [Pseudanabaenaceae cyanobacterium bins.39]|nr:ABC transporter ATP-binding protein [Pseudanabaenaceae cyanobacterium bins.39]